MNSVIDSALARSRTIIATLLLVLVSGTVAYVEIPKESDPDISTPIIYVRLSFDGISPEDSERLLIRPMEAELRVIEGLKEMRSSGYEGGASVVLEFEAGFDADAAMDEVREQVDLAKPELPDGADEPTVHEVNLSLFPVLVVILSGDVPERTLLRLARELRDAVEGISSVLAAEIAGDREGLVRQANWQKVGGASPPERRSNQTTFLREPCVGSREGAGEASAAVRMGGAIEHRKSDGPGCRGFQIGRRQHRRHRFGEMSANPAVSENPCTFARLLLGPWEVFKLPLLS